MGYEGSRSNHQSETDGARIRRLEHTVDQLLSMIHDLTSGPITASTDDDGSLIGLAAPGPMVPVHDRTAATEADPAKLARAADIRERIRTRRLRESYFPADCFADPAWDMMLDLYAAHYEGVRVSVSSLCIAASVPATTALRRIKQLTAQGLFVRDHDPIDGRRVFIRLSEDAKGRLDRYFDSVGY